MPPNQDDRNPDRPPRLPLEAVIRNGLAALAANGVTGEASIRITMENGQFAVGCKATVLIPEPAT